MYKKHTLRCVPVIVAALLLAFTSSSASAANVNLFAGTKIITMPDGQDITMWGFGLAPGSITIPGPQITITPGDTTLTINLTNNLPEPVSLIINGQKETSMTPVWTDSSDTIVGTGSRPAGDYTSRVRSFTREAAPAGGVATYQWNNLKPGTYLYTSGTNPALQIQMGLYGALKVDAANKNVYNNPATAYAQDVVLLFSEVDPVVHAAVATDNYGPGGTVTSMVHYKPRYFLINGKAYPDLTPIAAGALNTKTLIRFLNAGGKTHAPALLGGRYMTLLAEDGNLYPYLTRQQCSLELPAGKTIDVMITNPGTVGNIPVYDRALNLTNAGLTSPGIYPGGMLVFLVFEGTDSDSDGILDVNDNCPTVANGPVQGSCYNYYTGQVGGKCTTNSQCMANPSEWYKWCDNAQYDMDKDGVGDVCEIISTTTTTTVIDTDSDGILDVNDNCPTVANGPVQGSCYNYYTGQVGGACTTNSQCMANPSEWYKWCDNAQYDVNKDGIGDVCRP